MNANIVVVEEDSRGHGLLARWLEHAGYQVREATSAMEACRRIAARPPDLVVIDAGTSYRSGLELLGALFGDLTLPAVRTLVLTSDGALAAYAEDLGAEFLARPVLRERLLAAVARSLDAPVQAGAPIAYESAIARNGAPWPMPA